MARSYRILDGAYEDIVAIASYLRTASGAAAAEAFLSALESKALLICEQPNVFGLSRMSK